MRKLYLAALFAMAGQAAGAQSCQIATPPLPCEMASTLGSDFWSGTWHAVAGPLRVTMLGRTHVSPAETLGPAVFSTTEGGNLHISVAGTDINGRKNGFSGRLNSIAPDERQVLFWDEDEVLSAGMSNLSFEDFAQVFSCDTQDLPQWSATVLSTDGYELNIELVAMSSQDILAYKSFDGMVDGTHLFLERRAMFTRDDFPTDVEGVVWIDHSEEFCESSCSTESFSCRDWDG